MRPLMRPLLKIGGLVLLVLLVVVAVAVPLTIGIGRSSGQRQDS